jgi:hypothetical protein
MPSPTLSNFNKATKYIGRIIEEGKDTKFLQDLDLVDSPHREKDLIGENVDLDLLYLSLK